MKLRHALPILALLLLTASAVWAGTPTISPWESPQMTNEQTPPIGMNKAFGDPTDYLASALAGGDYIRYMQADVTEDNAGNGAADTDPADAGWDWSTYLLSHSDNQSSGNLTGVIANSLLDIYLLSGDPALLTTLQDVADREIAIGPDPAYPVGLHYAGDIMFLLRFAELPGVADPALYRNAALAVWNWRLVNTGTGTAASVAEAIRDGRYSQGYSNGIIAWDVGAYVEAVAMLDAAFPGMGYDADADAMAEVLWQDSFNLTPGYFDFNGVNMGYDPLGEDKLYWWYTLGVSGLIQAFSASGTHLTDLALLETRLLECQYDDGAFSSQYGAPADINSRSWQTTAYAVAAIHNHLSPAAGNLSAMVDAGYWLAATQDVSGGWLYSDGKHYPEIGAECAAAMAFVWDVAGAAVTTAVDGPDPAACGLTKTATFSYDRGDATPGLFGYEVILQIDGPASFTMADFTDVYGMDYFQAVDQGGGQWSVNGTLFGAVPGILADVDLFTLDMLTTGDGTLTIDVVSYNLREPDNTPIFADVTGASFVVDCTSPDPVTDITALPHHDRIEVLWTHDGTDVDHYVVFSGVWHDGAGVSVYPEYDDVVGNTIPTRPADYAAADLSDEWDELPAVAVTTTDQIWPNADDRGVYYYEVFAVDAAGNVSVPAAANDRATNYWLGDVDEDGFVAVIDDINSLGACFGTAEGQEDYDEYCDVGRTDDWSRLGIPLTDSVINFEDLMVFSMNFSVVSDINKAGPALAGSPVFEWVALDETHWALRLVEAGGLKGLRVRTDASVTVTGGDLLNEQGSATFLRNLGQGLDANLAVLGRDVVFSGSGDLLVVEMSDPVASSELVIDARDASNARLEVKWNDGSASVLPRAFALHPNVPNPFNPRTKISFSLPETQAVKLTVYAVDGRKVATLIDEVREAGTHEVFWSGRDDAGRTAASGAYFCRIDAGPYSQVRKMTLMK